MTTDDERPQHTQKQAQATLLGDPRSFLSAADFG